MKFQPDHLSGTNVVSRHEESRLWVGASEFDRSVIVPWQGTVMAWPPARHEDLTRAHFDLLSDLGAAVVIFGSGRRLRFVSPALLQGLIERGIGVETMDTAAACRTYNVLASEGRAVVAALLVGDGPA